MKHLIYKRPARMKRELWRRGVQTHEARREGVKA